MKKIIIVLFVLGFLGSCKMFSAMDTMISAIGATGEYIIEELEEE